MTQPIQLKVFKHIRQAHRLMSEIVEDAFTPLGHTRVQYEVLAALNGSCTSALTAGNISAWLRHDSGALTRVIDHLEKRGLVTRSRHLSDRRKVTLMLTPAGIDTVAKITESVISRLDWLFIGLTPNEVRSLVASLELLDRSLNHLLDAEKDGKRESGSLASYKGDPGEKKW